MKKLALAVAATAMFSTSAFADITTSCADWMAMSAEQQAEMAPAMAQQLSDARSTASNTALNVQPAELLEQSREACAAYPDVSVDNAMEKSKGTN